MTIIFSFTILSSCNTYDEEDVTIIGILKINDLIEKKLMPVCDAEVEKLNKAIEEYNESIDMYNFSNLFNLGLSNGIKELDYDVDQINLMAEKYNTSDNNFDLNKLEIDLTTELWTYFNLTYSDIIPAKAQNTQEGRYFTITELKEKYPDTLLLFITPPSAQELKNRLIRRGTEEMDVIEKRMKTAAWEAQFMDRYDYIVINDKLQACVEELHAIIQSEHRKSARNLVFAEQIKEELEKEVKD